MTKRKAKKRIKQEPEMTLEHPKTLITILQNLFKKSGGRING